MPSHAAATGSVDFVLPLAGIAPALIALVSAASSELKSSELKSSELKLPALKPSLSPPAVLLIADSTALARVRAAWRSAEEFSGSGAGPEEVSRLVGKALAEIDGCVEALAMAEAALVDQNGALESLQSMLWAERSHYKELFQTVSEALIETDTNSIVHAVSPAAAKLLGRNARYMIKRPFMNHVPPRERPGFESMVLQALAAGGSERKLSLRARTGLPALSATAVTMKDSRGSVNGLLWRVRLDDEVGEGPKEPSGVTHKVKRNRQTA